MGIRKVQISIDSTLQPLQQGKVEENADENVNGASIFPIQNTQNITALNSLSNEDMDFDNEEALAYETYSEEIINEDELILLQLEAEIEKLESEYSANQEAKGVAGTVGGFFSSCWNAVSGKGFKDKDRAELDEKIALLEAAKADLTKLNDAYKSIMGADLTDEVKQNAITSQDIADSLATEDKQQIIDLLKTQADSLAQMMQQAQDDQGWFSSCMGGINNFLGFGTSSNKANAKIEEFIKQVNSLNPNDPDFAAKYQALTGEALSLEGLNELAQGFSKVSNSSAAEAIMDYEETQAAAKEIGTGIVTGLVVAACVIAAPVTGGASLVLGAAVGGTTTVLINGTDTIGTSKSYSLEQGILDFAGGAIDGTVTALTLGGANLAGKGLSVFKGLGGAAAKEGARQVVSGGFKNALKTSFGTFGKAALRSAGIATFSSTSNYLLDTVGKDIVYNDLWDNYTKSDTPTNIVQNEDGTYSVYYPLADSKTGDLISYEIETLDSLSQDEEGNLIKGNVLSVSRSNEFNWGDLATQTAISAGSAVIGTGIGKITGSIINPYATTFTNSVALGNVAEIATDMTLSLGADYLITSAQAGEFVDTDEFFSWDRILNEGRNQIRGLLIGIASSKLDPSNAVLEDSARSGLDVKTPAELSVKIDGEALPAEQLKVLEDAGKLILDENDTQGAIKLLIANGATQEEAEAVVAEFAGVSDNKAVGIVFNPETEELSAIRNQNKTEEIALDHQVAGDNVGVRFESSEKEQIRPAINKMGFASELDEDDVDDLLRAVEYTKKRLQVSSIEFTAEDISDIMAAGEYFDPSQIITKLTSMSNIKDVGKAYMLAQLIKQGTLTKEMVMDITKGWNASYSFDKAFCDNYREKGDPDYFVELLRACGFDDKKVVGIKGTAKMISDGIISPSDLRAYPNIVELVEMGISEEKIAALFQLDDVQIKNTFNFIQKQEENVDFDVLQNGNGVVLKTVKQQTLTVNFDGKTEEVPAYKNKIILEDGAVLKTSAYKFEDGSYETWYHKSDSILILKYANDEVGGDIQYQIEIKNNQQGEPSEIVYTKASENLAGAYETTVYTLRDYPEDFDILEAVKNGTVDQKIKEMNLPQGNKTSNVVVNNDGSISYVENHSRNGNNIQRNYTQQTDSNGNTTKTHYTYQITGQDGSQLLSLDRSWQKNPNGTTTTVINGKTYTTSFDDSTSEIKIVQDDGTETIIPIGKLLADKSGYSSNMLSNLENKFGSLEDANKAFFEHCKTMPADTLLTIGINIEKIVLLDDPMGSSQEGRKVEIGLNIPVTSHELGHSIDFDAISGHSHDIHLGTIATNQDLIKIYEKEFLQFKKGYPELAQQVINYFSQTGGGLGDTGLNELIAEANMLMTTYAQDIETVETRSQYLVRYFPQTVAKIGELLGYHSPNPTQQTFQNEKLTSEQNQILSGYANDFARTFESNIETPKAQIKGIFARLESVVGVSARAKGASSIFDKISNKATKGELTSLTEVDCLEAVGDAYGTRVQMRNLTEEEAKGVIEEALVGSNVSYDNFVSYMKGDYTNLTEAQIMELGQNRSYIIDCLKTAQTQEVVNALRAAIENKEIVITELNNYGNQNSSYFTDAQLQQIAQAYFETYKKRLDIVTIYNSNNIINGTVAYADNGTRIIETQHARYIEDGSEKGSGYPSTHINVEHTLADGSIGKGETQFRGTEVNAWADDEHIPYDIGKGKIRETDPRYSSVYGLIDEINNDPAKKASYQEYSNDLYRIQRLRELGLPIDLPKIETYLAQYGYTKAQMDLINAEGLRQLNERIKQENMV